MVISASLLHQNENFQTVEYIYSKFYSNLSRYDRWFDLWNKNRQEYLQKNSHAFSLLNIEIPPQEMMKIFNRYGVIALRKIKHAQLTICCGNFPIYSSAMQTSYSRGSHAHHNQDTSDIDILMNPSFVANRQSPEFFRYLFSQKKQYARVEAECMKLFDFKSRASWEVNFLKLQQLLMIDGQYVHNHGLGANLEELHEVAAKYGIQIERRQKKGYVSGCIEVIFKKTKNVDLSAIINPSLVQLQSLATWQIKTLENHLTTAQFNRLSPHQLGNDRSLIQKCTNKEAISKLHSNQLKLLSSRQVSIISTDKRLVQRLPKEIFSHLSKKQCQLLSSNQVKQIASNKVVQKLHANQISSLRSGQLSLLGANQVRFVAQNRIQHLRDQQLRSLTRRQVRHISDKALIQRLSGRAVSSLSLFQARKLKRSQLKDSTMAQYVVYKFSGFFRGLFNLLLLRPLFR